LGNAGQKQVDVIGKWRNTRLSDNGSEPRAKQN